MDTRARFFVSQILRVVQNYLAGATELWYEVLTPAKKPSWHSEEHQGHASAIGQTMHEWIEGTFMRRSEMTSRHGKLIFRCDGLAVCLGLFRVPDVRPATPGDFNFSLFGHHVGVVGPTARTRV
jgi:hypothetical protein